MKKTENECVGCPERLCGSDCPCRNVTRYYCDNCGEEFVPGDLYDYDSEMLCRDCLLSNFKTIREVEK